MPKSWTTPLGAARGGTLARGLSCGLIGWLLATGLASAQVQPLIILKSVEISGEGETAVVFIEADGPLPMPATGRVDSPARFFLDFPGIITGTHGSRGEGHPPIDRVRVALHSSNPPVTRVVLDLAQHLPVQIEAEARGAGRIRLVVGTATAKPGAPPTSTAEPRARAEAQQSPLITIPASPVTPANPEAQPPVREPLERPGQTGFSNRPAELPPVMPIPAAPPSTAPPMPSSETRVEPPPPAVYPVRSGAPASKPSAGDMRRYREQVDQPLNRLRVLRALLTEIDQQELKPPEGLPAARAELGAVIRVLAGVRPPDALKPTHDLLLRSASLAMMSATLRADAGLRADPTAIRNASSGAAGALLLLDRVCIEIGCSQIPEVK